MKITEEQQAVIEHPPGCNARVLAVAGSGKTTTLVYRIHHLINERGVDPSAIQVLMFNRDAKDQFLARLRHLRIRNIAVNTFNSLGHQILGAYYQNLKVWTDEHDQVTQHVRKAIQSLEKAEKIPPNKVSPQTAKDAIELWKSSLIKPEHAGHRYQSDLVLVYHEFEKLRQHEKAFTYSDQVNEAVRLLEKDAALQESWHRRIQFLIIDEYQDVNRAQERLLELLIGRNTELMVVGDDDQTIYEWRGTRPDYILYHFPQQFSPHIDYVLSQSFRFGPLIAQCAHNVITFNAGRFPKPLVAYHHDKRGELSELRGDSNTKLLQKMQQLFAKGVHPYQMRVLVSIYAQSHGLQAAMLQHGIGFDVDGREPFIKQYDVQTLVNYLRLALVLDEQMTRETREQVLDTINRPGRIKKELAQAQIKEGYILRDSLSVLIDHPTLRPIQKENLTAYLNLLVELRKSSALTASRALRLVIDRVGYIAHLLEFYGEGRDAYDRSRAVMMFIDYVNSLDLRWDILPEHIDNLDPKFGLPDNQLVIISSIHRAKGLEFDYIFVPYCQEGYQPLAHREDSGVFDTRTNDAFVLAPSLESERRLFYVALTRAREAAYFGTELVMDNNPPSRFLEEMQVIPTRGLVSTIQDIQQGNVNHTALIEAVHRCRSNKWISESLIACYLHDSSPEALVARQALDELPMSSFRYRRKYPDVRRENANS